MGIILGLVAAFGWGSADIFARYAAKSIGSYKTLIYMQFFGLAGIGVYLLLTGELQSLLASHGWQPWAWAFLVAALNIFSSSALYKSFEIGVMTIVSPIASSYAAVTVVLSFLAGEAVSTLHTFGMAVVLIGVILAATPLGQRVEAKTHELTPDIAGKRSRVSQGVILAIIASLGYGVCFWLMGFRVIPELGGIVPVWIVRLSTPCVLLLFAPLARQNVRLPRGGVWWYLLCLGILDTVAFVANAVGVTVEKVSVINVITSLYSAVTVVLAWIFLRERLSWSQWIGIGIIFVGIILVNI